MCDNDNFQIQNEICFAVIEQTVSLLCGRELSFVYNPAAVYG